MFVAVENLNAVQEPSIESMVEKLVKALAFTAGLVHDGVPWPITVSSSSPLITSQDFLGFET